jgi:hypothetical protein
MPLFIVIFAADVAAVAAIAAVKYASRKLAENPVEVKTSSVVIPFPTLGRKAKRVRK